MSSTATDFSALFTRDESFIFLNAGTLSRTPLSTLQAMEERRREEERNPTKEVFRGPGLLWEVQKRLAPFLGVQPQDLFLRSNITSALNEFLFGLPLSGQGEILATSWEYGATLNMSRLRAERAAFSFRMVPLPLSPAICAEEIAQTIIRSFTPLTKVLVLSHVSTGQGAVLPVAEIAQVARERGIITVVDGAHAVGALPLDIAALGVDFYGGNFHKWFMGPKGSAFGWVHPRWRERIEWAYGGWASFSVPDHYRGFPQDLEAAQRVFPGTMDLSPFLALPDLLQFWQSHGPESLRAHQARLRDRAAGHAEQFGWERVSPREDLGPLVAFRAPESWPRISSVDLATRIYQECAVQIALPMVAGEMLLRLSPGIYVTDADVDEGMQRLARFGG